MHAEMEFEIPGSNSRVATEAILENEDSGPVRKPARAGNQAQLTPCRAALSGDEGQARVPENNAVDNQDKEPE